MPSLNRSRPDWLLYALVAAVLGYVWRVQDLFPILGSLKFVAVSSLAAFGIYILNTDRRRSLKSVRHRVMSYATMILVLMILSVPGSLYPGLSFDFVVQDHLKTFVLMVVLAASIRTLKDVERYALTQLFGAGLYCVFIMWKFDIGQDGRLSNLIYYDANDLGMLIVCTLPLGIYFLRSSVDWRMRIISACILLISTMTIIKTGSRGAFLGFIAVLAFMLFQFRAFTKQVRYGAVTVVVLVLLFLGNDRYWEMMRTILNPTDDYNWSGQSDGGRMEVWKRGVGYMLKHPLFGVGAHAFPVAEGTISSLARRQEFGIGLKWSAAHNSFVEIGAELGIPGLAAFILLLATAFYSCFRIGRTPPQGGIVAAEAALGQALCATLVGYLVVGSFLSQAYSAYMYITYGIIIGLSKVTFPYRKPITTPVVPWQRPRKPQVWHGRPATGQRGGRL
jgi:O-antigen ligase